MPTSPYHEFVRRICQLCASQFESTNIDQAEISGSAILFQEYVASPDATTGTTLDEMEDLIKRRAALDARREILKEIEKIVIETGIFDLLKADLASEEGEEWKNADDSGDED